MTTPLFVEPIPSSVHYRHIRSELTPEQWQWITSATIHRAKAQCECCQTPHTQEQPLNAVEKWIYDDEHQIMKLEKMIAVCNTCEHARKIQKTEVEPYLLEHLKTQNNFNDIQLRQHIQKAIERHKERSEHLWIVKFQEVIQYIESKSQTPASLQQQKAENQSLISLLQERLELIAAKMKLTPYQKKHFNYNANIVLHSHPQGNHLQETLLNQQEYLLLFAFVIRTTLNYPDDMIKTLSNKLWESLLSENPTNILTQRNALVLKLNEFCVCL